MLDAGKLDKFDALGYVAVPGLIGAKHAAEMAGAMWRELRDRFAITEAADTWPAGARRTVGRAVKDELAFARLASSPLIDTVDAFLGVGSWRRPRHWGAAMEVVFPAAPGSVWSLPSKAWHVDYHFDIGYRPLPGVKAIVLLDDVAPDGGATLVVPGSHRVLAQYLDTAPDPSDHSATQQAFLKSSPRLRELTRHGDSQARKERLTAANSDLDSETVRVVALAGSRGDAFFVHPWLLHCASPNTSTRPRLAYGENFQREDRLVARSGPSIEFGPPHA